MNLAQRTAATAAIVAMGLGTAACGGSSDAGSGGQAAGTGPSAAGTSGSTAKPSGGSGGSGGGAPSSCAAVTALAAKDLGVSGKVKTVSDPSTTLHCEFGYKNALDFGADVMIWNQSYIDKSILAANEKNMVGAVDVSGVGDAAFSAGSGPNYNFGAVKGHLMVVASGRVATAKLKAFVSDLLAQSD